MPRAGGGQGKLLLFSGFAIKSLMVTYICTTNLQILLLYHTTSVMQMIPL